jgi:hypothetical protein
MADFNEIQKGMQKQIDSEHAKRLARAVPVARKILKLIGEEADTIPLGDIERNDPGIEAVSRKLLALILEENVHWVDKDFVFQLALQALSFPADIAQTSLKNSWETVVTGLFGKVVQDLTAQEVDGYLKKGNDLLRASGEEVVQ